MRWRPLFACGSILTMVALGLGCERGMPEPMDSSMRADTGDSAAPDISVGADSSMPDTATPDTGRPSLCPPTGPFGTNAGDTAGEIELMDCDGTVHRLHDLCDKDAVWLWGYADWCPNCRTFANNHARRIYERFEGENFAAWMVITANSSFGPPTLAECVTIRDGYGLPMPTLIDPSGQLESVAGLPQPNDAHVVLRGGAEIVWQEGYSGIDVENRLASILE